MKAKKTWKFAIKTVSIICLSVLLLGSRAFASGDVQSEDSAPIYTLIDIDPIAGEDGNRIQNGWWWTSNSITYYCDTSITSSMKIKIQSALSKWSNVSMNGLSVSISFSETFDESSANIYFDYGKISLPIGQLAVTKIYDINGTENGDSACLYGAIRNCRIRIANPPTNITYSFSNSGEANTYNFESIVIHELGHALGIAHCHTNCTSNAPPNGTPYCIANVMCGTLYTATVRTTLQSYDKASLISLYCVYHPFS